jgi:hypothetical protein
MKQASKNINQAMMKLARISAAGWGPCLSAYWLNERLPEADDDSPFLKARWGDRRILAVAGPYRSVYDLERNQVRS